MTPNCKITILKNLVVDAIKCKPIWHGPADVIHTSKRLRKGKTYLVEGLEDVMDDSDNVLAAVFRFRGGEVVELPIGTFKEIML
jgi:hypothetical protein